MRSSGETITGSRRDSHGQTDDTQTQFDLPDEIWEQILSRLTLKENIRASAVSKRFLAIATSVRKANKPPLLLSAPILGDSYQFYDPHKRKYYFLNLPELRGAKFCYTRDGWLLMYNRDSLSLFFFNPYTRKAIKLPSLQLASREIAFSADPTSPECIIFSPTNINYQVVEICTCRPGEKEWTIVNYQTCFPFLGIIKNKIVFSKGVFYCLTAFGALGVYNPEKCSWSLQPVRTPEYCDHIFDKKWLISRFMAEHDGDIIVVCTHSDEYLFVFKLDRQNNTWVEMETLGGMTIFANFSTSLVRTDILGNMQNNVCFSKVQFYSKRCVSYSLDECRYFPVNQRYDWGKQDLFNNIWIDAPEDLQCYYKRRVQY